MHPMMMSYFRSVLKQSFFKTNIPAARTVLLTKPVNLAYESHCLKFYKDLLVLLKMNMEKTDSLESDLARLEGAEELTWGMRMAIAYRVEKKKIVRN
jgi:hypothetical protein